LASIIAIENQCAYKTYITQKHVHSEAVVDCNKLIPILLVSSKLEASKLH
jgi:hypothetical protein